MENMTIFQTFLWIATFIVAIMICCFIKHVIISGIVRQKWFVYKDQIYYVIPKSVCQGLFKEDQAPDTFRVRDWPLYDFKDSFAVDISEEVSIKSTDRK